MEVDTALSLSNTKITHLHHRSPFLQNDDESSRLNLARFAQEVDPPFLSLGPITQQVVIPTPIRSFQPDHGCMSMHTVHLASPSQRSDVSTKTGNKKKSLGMRKKDHLGTIRSKDDPRRKRRNPARIKEGHDEPYAQLPPALVEEAGPGWVFLYRKRLEVSDVMKSQNRLFVTAVGTERIVEGFLWEEERRAVVDQAGPGIEFLGMDCKGRKYKLRMKTWGSLGMTAVKTEWNKMVKGNGAEAGQWVDLWGRRLEEGGFRLAFNFSDGGEDGGGQVKRG